MKHILGVVLLLWAAMGFAQLEGTGYILQQGSLIEDFESMSGWVKQASGQMSYVSDPVYSGSVALQLSAIPNVEVYALHPISIDLSSFSTFSFWVYVAEPQNYGQTAVVSLAFSGNNYVSRVEAGTGDLRCGWNKIVFSKSDFVSKNGGTFEGVNNMRLRLFAKGWPNAATFDHIVFGEYSRPKVMVTFDDGFDDHYQVAFPYMRDRDIPGTCYLISSRIGMTEYMTVSQCQEMYDAGWEMANHTFDHRNLATLCLEDQEAEIGQCESFLVAQGWTRGEGHRHLAYPYGSFDHDSLTAVQTTGQLTARSTFAQRQANALDEPAMLYGDTPVNTDSLASLKSMVDKVVDAGAACEIAFHRLESVAYDPTIYSISNFKALIDYLTQLRDQGKIDLVTKADWYDGLVNPRLQAAELEEVDVLGGTDLHLNVSLESLAKDPGVDVSLQCDHTEVSVPSQVSIPAGEKALQVVLPTQEVSIQTDVTIVATVGATSTSVTCRLEPLIDLDAFRISSNSVNAGASVDGEIDMASNVMGDTIVNLDSNENCVTVPSHVVVTAGTQSTGFEIETHPVGTETTAVLTAQLGSTIRAVSLTVTVPLTLTSFECDPDSVVGGSGAQLRMGLNHPAESDVDIDLTSDCSSAVVNSSCTIPEGEQEATSPVETLPVGSTTTATLTGTLGSTSLSATLVIRPPVELTELGISPNVVTSGAATTGTLGLSALAPADIEVDLTSSEDFVQVPSQCPILAGNDSATFAITTTLVTTTKVAIISASLDGTTLVATVTVNPPALILESFVLDRDICVGGETVLATATLNYPAPTGAKITIFSSNRNALASPILIAPGSTSKSLQIRTKPVTFIQTATFQATYNGTSITRVLTLTPP